MASEDSGRATQPTGSPAAGSERRPGLLVVDDAPEITRLVERLGQRSGYVVRSCIDVAGAWEALQGWRPDLVLLDLNLPGENGLVLCRRLRQRPELASLRVALFGDWVRAEDIVAGLEAGIDCVIAKDLLCRPAEWQARLQEVFQTIEGRLTDREPEEPPAPLPLQQALAGLNQGLHALARRSIAPSILSALLRRTVAKVCGEFRQGWVGADGLTLDAQRLDLAGHPEQIGRILQVFAALLGRLGGRNIREPFEQAVLAGCPEAAVLWNRRR